MNYFDDDHDMRIMIAIARRVLDIIAHWPAGRHLGPLVVPAHLADKHGYKTGDTPSDVMLADAVLHYATTVYHLTSTCRIGGVVDPRLRVHASAGCGWPMRA